MDAGNFAPLLMPLGLAILGILAQRFGVDSRDSWSAPVPVPLTAARSMGMVRRDRRTDQNRSIYVRVSRIASRAPERARSNPYASEPGSTPEGVRWESVCASAST